jgi:bacterioferritin (cytochrome b1)
MNQSKVSALSKVTTIEPSNKVFRVELAAAKQYFLFHHWFSSMTLVRVQRLAIAFFSVLIIMPYI